MKFDFCFATYNSEKWLENCIKALSQLEYNKQEVSLYFADNASTDGTVACLEKLKAKYSEVFANFEVVSMGKNTGFGTASNSAARKGSGDFVFFFNVDTEIFPNALTELDKAVIDSDESWGAFELRQFPYEHPKYYNPITLEVSWCSGATFVLRRELFEKTGGFDESIFMYAEDVELSWRIRLLGYRIQYVPSALTYHYVYQSANEIKPHQMAGSTTANLIIRCKYGTAKDIDEWYKLYDENKQHFEKVDGVPALISEQLSQIKKNKLAYRKFYNEFVKNSDFKPNFMGFDYEFARGGAFYENHLPKQGPKISVVVRTFRRPDVLALTLLSLGHQTYKNFEVIVVEDGDTPMAEAVALNAKNWLDLKYIPAGKSVGQCEAGNIGLRAASGDYLAFLDDDDYYFAEHLEIMACLANENPDAGLLVAGAIEAKVKYNNATGSDFEYVAKRNSFHKSISGLDICLDNPFPIQAPIFKRELFEQYGGLDIRLDGLHDWDLWVRLFSHTKLVNTQKVTSIYKIPAESNVKKKRDAFINHYRKIVYDNFKEYGIKLDAQEIQNLVWSPKQIEETMAEQEEDESLYNALHETAAEILSSNTWKASIFLRFIPRGLSEIFGLISFVANKILGAISFIFSIVQRLLSLIGRGFSAIFKFFRTLADIVAPRKPKIETASKEELHSFVILYEKSMVKKLLVFSKKNS